MSRRLRRQGNRLPRQMHGAGQPGRLARAFRIVGQMRLQQFRDFGSKFTQGMIKQQCFEGFSFHNVSGWVEGLAQVQDGVVQAGADGADRDGEHLGDLFVRQFLLKLEQQRLALRLGQPGNRLAHRF